MELTFSLLLLLTVMSGCRGGLVPRLEEEPVPQQVMTRQEPVPRQVMIRQEPDPQQVMTRQEPDLLQVMTKDSEGAKIIGGQELKKNSWPFLVKVFGYNGTHLNGCGGSLIDASHVLSAAHCFELPNAAYYARVGEHHLDTVEGTEQQVVASQVFVHPKYDRKTVVNDVAVMKLSTPVNLNVNVGVIKMNSMSSCPEANSQCTVSGWGRMDGTNPSSSSKVPMTVDVTIEKKEVCRRWSNVDDTQLCAQAKDSGSCQGDSGGPLVCQCGSEKVLSGVVSFGTSGCISAFFPSVYARVSSYIPWINSVRKTTAEGI